MMSLISYLFYSLVYFSFHWSWGFICLYVNLFLEAIYIYFPIIKLNNLNSISELEKYGSCFVFRSSPLF
jgi:hypothetical protein